MWVWDAILYASVISDWVWGFGVWWCCLIFVKVIVGLGRFAWLRWFCGRGILVVETLVECRWLAGGRSWAKFRRSEEVRGAFRAWSGLGEVQLRFGRFKPRLRTRAMLPCCENLLIIIALVQGASIILHSTTLNLKISLNLLDYWDSNWEIAILEPLLVFTSKKITRPRIRIANRVFIRF